MTLQRRTPLARGRGLSPGKGLVRSAPLKAVSAARRVENRARRAMVRELFGEQPLCVVYDLYQVSPELIPAEVIARCGRWADDVHEPLFRSRLGSITEAENARPLCRDCHSWVHANEAEASALGLAVHSWDASKGGAAA